MPAVPSPPGPPAQLFPLHPLLHEDMLGYFSDLRRAYGTVVQFQMGLNRFVLLSEPDLIREVVVGNSQKFEKRTAGQLARRILGNNLVTSRGEEHRKQRRLLQPHFHRTRIAGFADTINATALKHTTSWRHDEVRDVAKDMVELTLNIVLGALFSSEAGGATKDISEAVTTILQFDRFRIPGVALLLSMPLPITRRFNSAHRLVDDFVYGLIRQRRTTNARYSDLLSMLIETEDGDNPGEHLNDVEIRDHVVSIILTGHETSAYGLAWAIWLLASNPEVQEKLTDELDRTLGGRLPTLSDLPRLVYTDCVIRETLRLFCPVWGFGRIAKADHVLDRYYIKANTQLIMSQWVVHRDPRYYPDPQKFRPERWTPEMRENLPKFAYFPFGGGVHQCIGDGFAWLELTLVVALIMQRWCFHLTPDTVALPNPGITLRIKDRLLLRLEGRN